MRREMDAISRLQPIPQLESTPSIFPPQTPTCIITDEKKVLFVPSRGSKRKSWPAGASARVSVRREGRSALTSRGGAALMCLAVFLNV